MKKKTQTKTKLGSVIANHIELINRANGRTNSLLIMAALAAQEEAKTNRVDRQ
jgi:hypothetical protein